MPHANNPKNDPKRSDGKHVITSSSGRRQPSHAPSGSHGAHSALSAGGSITYTNDTAEEKRKYSPVISSEPSSRTAPVVPYQYGSARNDMFQTTHLHGMISHNEKLGDRQSKTGAWLSTPQGYEVGIGQERRDDERQRLYQLVQDVGLSNDRGKGNNNFPCNAAHLARVSAAEERRCFELNGVGAWTDISVTKRAR